MGYRRVVGAAFMTPVSQIDLYGGKRIAPETGVMNAAPTTRLLKQRIQG